MDSSSLVTAEDFQEQKDFVKSVIASFHVKRGQSRAALITYGENSEKVLPFNSYISVNYIESVVDTATGIGGTPQLNKALVDAYDVLRGANPSVPRIVILIAATRKGEDPHKELIEAAAERIHDLGARVYVFAVGRDRTDESLLQVADHPQDVFKILTFKDLRSNSDSTAETIYTRVGELTLLCVDYCKNEVNKYITGNFIRDKQVSRQTMKNIQVANDVSSKL